MPKVLKETLLKLDTIFGVSTGLVKRAISTLDLGTLLALNP